MFKFITLVGLAIIASTAAKVIDFTTNEISTGDQSFDDAYKHLLGHIDKLLEIPGEVSPLFGTILPLVIRSVDTKCMHDNLKLHKFDAKFVDLANRFETLTKAGERELFYIHVVTSFRCTKKLRPINEFLFDFFLSFGHIVRAFKDEPELAEYQGYLRCANNYVVTHKLWDVVKYPIDYELKTEEAEMCSSVKTMIGDFIKTMDQIAPEAQDLITECLKTTTQDMIDFFVKYFLLLQVELTPEQRDQEFETYYKDYLKLYDEQVTCAYDFVTKIDDEKVNKIQAEIESKKSQLNLPF